MCMAHEISCHCGKQHASFHMKDSVLPHEAINRLYCPECSGALAFDPDTMIRDNGWVIDYDMDVARLLSQRMKQNPEKLTPEFLFDEGWCTWNGYEPRDVFSSVREREELLSLAKTDPKRYMEAIKTWSIEREERLRVAGWRKATLTTAGTGRGQALR